MTSSEKEKLAIDILKSRIALANRDDHYYSRWLRARHLNIDLAEQMLSEHLAWRSDFGADEILSWPAPEVLCKYFVGGFCGHDKDGCPLWVDPVGRIDMKGLSRSVSRLDIIKYQVRNLENLFQQLLPSRTAEEGRVISESVGIFDLDGFGMKNLWRPGMQVYIELAKLCERNYPEHMKTCFIVNAPRLFPIAYRVIRPFLDQKTAEKVRVMGSNYKAELLEHFAPEHLPERYGGCMRDSNGDPECKEFICYGGRVPMSYYRGEGDLNAFVRCVVDKGSSIELRYHMPMAGAKLVWEFMTDKCDISFQVTQEVGGPRCTTPVHVVQPTRIDASCFSSSGELLADSPCDYLVRFDNSYSWLRAKTIHYKIEIDRESDFAQGNEADVD